MIAKSGLIHTEYVGRKAAAYTIVSDFRVGIRVEILGNEIKILAADLYGREIKSCVHELAYKNDAAYFQNVCKEILAFRDSAMLCDEQILGVGFAIQGLISPDAPASLPA